MPYLLGCDFGGSSSKTTLLSDDGRVIAIHSQEYPTYYPHYGWAEQNPDDSYHAFCTSVKAILQRTGIHPDEIVALALDGATHTAVLLDEADTIIRPAIYWTDIRSSKQAEKLQGEYREQIVSLSYNTPSSLWTLPQLIWLAENEPEAHARIRKVLSMKDYVRYRLTGDYVTDCIEAMGTMLLDVAQNTWSRFLCALAGIDASIMPPIVDPMNAVSPLCQKAQIDTGLSGQTMVIAGATDTVMEVYASGAISKGQATVKLATAGRICPIVDRPIVDRQLVCYRHVVDGMWYPGTATKSSAASNRWYRDTFGGNYEEMTAQAATIPRGCNGLLFHPYLQGEVTPYMDDKLRASFTGASSSHTKAHFNRAVLEGVAFSMLDCFHVLNDMGIAPSSATIIGGGAKSALWRQIMADMLGIPLQLVEKVDSSLGSAMLAGVASGVFASHEDAVKQCVRIAGVVEPNQEAHDFYSERFLIYREIAMALAPIYHKL